MTRILPAQLKADARAASEEKRALSREQRLAQKQTKQVRVASAGPAEKDRVWTVLITAALNNESKAFFTRLNAKEQKFIAELGFHVEFAGESSQESWLDIHRERYKSELEAIDKHISFLETDDPLSEALHQWNAIRAQKVRELYSLHTKESLFGTKKTKARSKVTYEVEISEPESYVRIVEEYDVRWLFWLLKDGQPFLLKIEEKLAKSAKLGESYEILIAQPSDKAREETGENMHRAQRYERAWVSYGDYSVKQSEPKPDLPWTPYDYFSEDECVANYGPEPEIARYFLELLGYHCTLRIKKDEAVLKVKWSQ
jgi:hypothetical protein